MLWQMRYRKPQMVATDMIETPAGLKPADDYELAQKIGQAYCASQPGLRYIGISRAIIADASILDAPVVEETETALHKPSGAEQRDRLAKQEKRADQRIGA